MDQTHSGSRMAAPTRPQADVIAIGISQLLAPRATTQGQELRGQYLLHRFCQPQVGAVQVRSGQHGAGEIGIAEFGACQPGTANREAPQVHPGEACLE